MSKLYTSEPALNDCLLDQEFQVLISVSRVFLPFATTLECWRKTQLSTSTSNPTSASTSTGTPPPCPEAHQSVPKPSASKPTRPKLLTTEQQQPADQSLDDSISDQDVGMPYNTTAIPPRKEPTGTTQLPLSRVKKIVQADPDIQAFSNAAAFVLTRATELFTQMLAEKAHEVAKSEKKPRRNLQYRDIATAVANHENLQFLGDTVPKTMTYGEYLKRAAAKAGANKTKTNGESAVEAGQTTLDGMKSAAATNGTNGFGTHAAKLGEEREGGEDEREEDADPNEQLKKENLGPRLSSGSTISNPATYVNGKEGSEDVEMS
ncbi:hypothetical protein LZ554_003348 [Drepanopeziza brunnea f. sp. 'monogermtubi']|nr:hypothetical protein LZ554_003348 [Drepanopeziza brunnea f. sp. 'monogermtubi']